MTNNADTPEPGIPTPDKSSNHRKTRAPLKEIDWDKFEAACRAVARKGEIANMFDVTMPTLKRRAEDHYGVPFKEVYERFTAEARVKLRQIQIDQAKDNPSMSIHLGKHWLGQFDRNTQEIIVKQQVARDTVVLETIKSVLSNEPELLQKVADELDRRLGEEIEGIS